MNLFSIEFLILLLATFVVYYVIYAINKLQKRINIPQWSVLLVASLIFYGFTNYIYLLYLAISSLVSYGAAIMSQYEIFKLTVTEDDAELKIAPYKAEPSVERKRYEKIVTALSIIINAGILIVLKYFNFFSGTVSGLFKFNAITYNFIIPLGISFYTFSLIAYNIDVYKRETEAEMNPFKFLLFVAYFPKILQGPISSYDKLKEDGLFDNHRFEDNDYLKSLFRISVGLIKKIAIANVLNLYVNASYANIDKTYGVGLIVTSFLYTIQIFTDFSGFADITIGISGLFGIKLEENFDVPYISSSLSEFWRRWHMTLGRWLRKYIYIPLGGNRVQLWKWILNILIVWLVSGFWHGANWTFILWGLFNGIVLVIEGLPKQLQKKKEITTTKKQNQLIDALKTAGTLCLINAGWILFRSANIKEAANFIWRMIQIWFPSSYSAFADSSISKANGLLLLSSILIGALIIMKAAQMNKDIIITKFKKPETIITISKFAITIIFFSISLFVFLYLNSIGGGESSFIYFDF
jgi:alginate O-acetyltransferase complex protein AlgI